MAAPSPKGIMNVNAVVFKLQEVPHFASEKGIQNVKYSMEIATHQMDNTDASSLGFARSPERSTSSTNDHYSKLGRYRIRFSPRWNAIKNVTAKTETHKTMSADGTTSFMKLRMS